MLFQKLKNAENFTNNEKEIAKYILANSEKIANMTASELAKATFTSKATIVRLSKKLGFDGYLQFKLRLVAELSKEVGISKLLQEEPITENSSYTDVINTLPALYDRSIKMTKLNLDKNALEKVVSKMDEADFIDIYGVGIGYNVARSAKFKMQTIGVSCDAYDSVNSYYVTAKKDKKTVALLISFTGKNKQIIKMAKYLKERTDQYVVAVVGPHNDDIKNYCDDLIEVPNRESLLNLDVISSYIGMTYIFDIFFSLLLVKNYDKHVETAIGKLSYMDIVGE